MMAASMRGGGTVQGVTVATSQDPASINV
jgi:hypothetical protein